MVIISIEGMMGVGKTSLLDNLEKLGYKVYRERVNEWSFLDKFYQDPKRYGLVFQIEILLTFLKYEFDPDEIVFTERCPDTSYSVFSKILSSDGILTDEDCITYKKIYDSVNPWKPDIQIFLTAPVDICEKRVFKRRDAYEISSEYMKKVERYYNIYIKYNDIPVETIVCDKKSEDVLEDVLKIVKRIKNCS
jgi:deoxyadenosine/deoxycytidine kinase